jgi:hypothetical protein
MGPLLQKLGLTACLPACMHACMLDSITLVQDMENIASVFTNKTWQRGGFKAATKSMFKTKVDFKKKQQPVKKAPVLPSLQEKGPTAVLAGNALAGDSSSNSSAPGSVAGESSSQSSMHGSSSRKSLLSAAVACSDAAAPAGSGLL